MNQFITIRKTLGLTQKELAGILNISCKRLSQYENETAVLPTELNNDLDLFYSYMKLALSYKIDVNTMDDYMAQRKALEKLIQENKKQRDQISEQLTKAEGKNKEALAKKKMLWLLTKDKKENRFASNKRLVDYLQQHSDWPPTDIMSLRITLGTLNSKKGKLESQWRKLQWEIEFLERNPKASVTAAGK